MRMTCQANYNKLKEKLKNSNKYKKIYTRKRSSSFDYISKTKLKNDNIYWKHSRQIAGIAAKE